MKRLHVSVKELPPVIRDALRQVGSHHADVQVEIGESLSAPGSYGKGYRGQVYVVNMATGEGQYAAGSWGGSNPFAQHPVDEPSGESSLPPGFFALTTGGRYWTLHLNPANVAAMLPSAGGEVTPREAYLLAVFAKLNSAGRKDQFDRHRSSAPHPSEIAELESRGFIKVNRAGAVTITASGRNLAGSSYYDVVPRPSGLEMEKPKRITAEDLLRPIGLKPR